MKFSHIKIRSSLVPKIGTLRDCVLRENFDIIAITEKWLTGVGNV